MLLGRTLFAVVLTLFLIALDWFLRKDAKKSAVASAAAVYIFSMLYMGMMMRSLPPFFFAYMLSLLGAWISLLWYLYKGRLYRIALLLPLIVLALFIAATFMGGSRYET